MLRHVECESPNRLDKDGEIGKIIIKYFFSVGLKDDFIFRYKLVDKLKKCE